MYVYIPHRKYDFFGLVVPEGEILIRKNEEDELYDFFTWTKGCSDLVFQFGCFCLDNREALDYAIGNYENGNMSFQN